MKQLPGYITAMAMEKKPVRLERGNLSIVTNSDTYYKYMTSLIHQIIFLMGQKNAILSAINSNGNFEDDLYNTFEENTNKILKNFDILLNENNKEIKDEEKMIDIYFQTQELIYKTYFKKIYRLLVTKDEVDKVVQKLFDYESIVGKVNEKEENISDLENGKEYLNNDDSVKIEKNDSKHPEKIDDKKKERLQYNKNFERFMSEMDEKFYKKYLDIDAKAVRNLPAIRKRSFIIRIIEKIKQYFGKTKANNIKN